MRAAAGDHQEAARVLTASLQMSTSRGDAEEQALCHESIAAVQLDLGEPRMARMHLEEALALSEAFVEVRGCSCEQLMV